MTSPTSRDPRLEAVEYDPFAGESITRVVPTTEPQREVWLADRLGREASLAYNESSSLRLRGPLDLDAMRAALADLVGRHESLRATVSASGEELVVSESPAFAVELVDVSGLDASARESAVAERVRMAVDAPFDLEKGPLFRAEIMRLAPDEHHLTFTGHHIVLDGWSAGVVVRELAKLYAARQSGSAADLPAAPSFGDYAASQNAAAGGEAQRADEAWWLARLAGPLPVLDLPTDRPRPAFRTFASRREDYVLDAELVTAVRKLGARRGASLFAALLAGFGGVLQRLSGTPEVIIGIPAAGQSVGGLDGLVGHCVNLLPLRLEIGAEASAGELIGATQARVLDAYEHQSCTFGALLKGLALARDPSRLPLVSVMFNLDQALDPDAAGFTGLAAEFAGNPRTHENFELFVNAVQVKGALRLETQYNSDLFDGETVRRWLACYETLLRSACAAADAPVSRLALAPEGDLRLVESWNATAADYDRAATVHRLVEAQAARTPHAVALRCGGQALTYRELDERAGRVAGALRARGARRGTLVGLHVRRGPEMVAAMLGTLKAGAAYVPLDPSYPAERLGFMAQDAGLAVLVTESALAALLAWPAERTLRIDADAAEVALAKAPARDGDDARPEDPAYVIYTSGSTGKPKGVIVPHRAVVNFLAAMAREPGLAPGDRIVAVTTLSFDIAVNELLLPLTVGAEIVLALPQESSDGAVLANLLAASGANVMQATPATWHLLLSADWKGAPGFKALCGGEALAPELARELRARTAQLWNMYGPTETTVWSTCALVGDGPVDIGRPIANTSVWVLDEARQPCPVGVPGEIWIGGDGVSLGYLNRAELTAERFIDDPFARPGARLYRTGDRGRWRATARLEHLGRLDFQVKVRGYRIELGEIESALATCPGVAQSVVMAREDRPGDVRLVAYAVARSGAGLVEEAVKAHLRVTLPEYMVPQHVLTLPAIPTLPNGKVDRKGLPAPQAAVPARDYVAPRDDLERTVAAEMEASLGMPGVGIHDDFFTLGGHSLLAAQLTARLNRALGCELTMRALFAAPTIARLADAIAAARASPAAPARAPIAARADRSEAPLSVMQERLYFLEELYPGRVTYNAPSAHRLLGVMDEDAFGRAFNEMLRRQPALRTRFEPRGDGAVQRIEDLRFDLFPAEDLSHLAPAAREEKLRERLEALTAETFDLKRAPLFKARMFRLSEAEHVLFFMPHHIVWDGWSFDLLYDEMSALYAAYCENRPHGLTPLRVDYGDFAAWHREWVEGEEFARQLAFWRGRLGDLGRAQELPTDRPRRPGMSGAGDTEWIVVDRARTDSLHELSRRCGTTVFVTALAACCALLHGYSGHTHLVVGTPVRGRNTLELEGIMGYFNNLVPLHVEVRPAESFMQLVERVKAVVVEGFSCPDVPLEQLAAELAVERGAGGSILYQALFSFQDARQRVTSWGGLTHSPVPLFQRGATEDLGMWFVETGKGLHGGVTYNTDILDPATARAVHAWFLKLLELAVAQPQAAVASLLDVANVRRKEPAAPTPAAAPAGSGEPTSETEKLLASIWRAQLKIARVGTQDNFFDMGGHSLLAMQAILAMEEKTGKRIDRGRYIFETLGQIARAYDAAQPETAAKGGGLRKLFGGLFGGKRSSG